MSCVGIVMARFRSDLEDSIILLVGYCSIQPYELNSCDSFDPVLVVSANNNIILS